MDFVAHLIEIRPFPTKCAWKCAIKCSQKWLLGQAPSIFSPAALAVFVQAVLGLVLAQPLQVVAAPGTGQPLSLTRGEVRRVAGLGELKAALDAANRAKVATTLLLANGTYLLDVPALDIQCPGLVIRSATGNRDAVIVRGPDEGTNGAVGNVFLISANDVTIADLTLGYCRHHGVQVRGEEPFNVAGLRVHNCRIVNCNQQFIKGSSSENDPVGATDGCIEQCLFEFTSGWAYQFYTGGIDIHKGVNWIVRDNLFRNLRTPAGQPGIAEHAVHFWKRCPTRPQNIVVERNWIVNCDRGIGFGLSNAEGGLQGGASVIRNNMVFNDGTGPHTDVGIGLEYAANVQVDNNTVVVQKYWAPIEYRFAGSSNLVFRNNLVNGPIQRRDDAPLAAKTKNLERVEASWFRDFAHGDLRSTAAAKPAVEAGEALDSFHDDVDGNARPRGSGWAVGASQIIDNQLHAVTKDPGRESTPGNPNSGPPYSDSLTIGSLAWHWETLTTAAPGSDLWPVTWGPDDNLYAAWGDGGGFGSSDSDGRVPIGFARIEGTPEHWQGFNVNGGKDPEHPASFPKKGKTTGVAFVDGVFYATMNLEDGRWPDVNHVLIWSTNRGATWTKADWLFPKGDGNFQPAKFFTFGRDYTGVPGPLAGYVYICGPKQSADRGSGNRLYLVRAPRDKLREHAAYEFFQGVNDAGMAVWAVDSAQAQPVFTDPNGVTPGSIVYDPSLRRFLLTCFHVGPGQLGVFEAPNPWGPWRTITYVEDWGGMGHEGEGLTCGFPQKWMSTDGLTLWSVFSVYGDGAKKGINAHDKFNLVKVTLHPVVEGSVDR
jgi:Domain of unknown function (DUF4185)/Right handed beta helix region